MEVEFTPSSDIIENTSLFYEREVQGKRSQLLELKRLATFQSLKKNIHPTCSKGLFAKVGLYYVPADNKVKCEACDFEIELNSSDIDPITIHINNNPECRFVLDQSQLCSMMTESVMSDISRTNLLATSDMQLNTTNGHDNSSLQNLFLTTLSNDTVDKIRANTFSNWPLITPNVQDMVNAGWLYTNIADRVMCAYCNVLFHKWVESDRPYEIHRLKSPNCPFVLMTEKKAATMPTTNITITTEPHTQATVGAARTDYALACRRYESFKTWPHTAENPLPPIESFVEAGFFYTGELTIVRCFYCNGALRNWRLTDDPKIEHARWHPSCAYIRQYIGEDLYRAIQRKNRELQAQQNSQETTNGQTQRIVPWTDDEIDRMVKARLDLPVVEKLRQAGFSMAIIRKVFEMQLKFKKDDFKGDNDLRLACFMLDQQVKLINGNEASLLVPQDWLRIYTEGEEPTPKQSQPSQPQISQTQIKIIQTPKIITPVVPQSKILQRTEGEAMPCALCLTAERQVACLPCGHLISCVACGHSLKTCPICRATIKAFVRIYV